jgi:hypothetical protein
MLFADELGSIHERAEFFMPLLPDDIATLPLGILGGTLLVSGLLLLRRSPEIVGRAAWLIIAGFGVFALVQVLEVVEGMDLPRDWRRVRDALEEGIELLGELLLLGAVVHVQRRIGVFGPGLRGFVPQRGSLTWIVTVCAALSVPVMILRLQFTAEDLVIPRRGEFGASIPVLIYLVGAFAALRGAARRRTNAVPWVLLACVFVLLSLDTQCHLHRYFSEWARRSDVGLLWGLPLLAGLLMLICERYRLSIALAAIVAFTLSAFSVSVADPTPSLLLPYAVSFASTICTLALAPADEVPGELENRSR